jgi:hypothetical protein
MSDLNAWLRQLGLERYAEALAREEIDLAVLPELSEADLERIGLPLGPRRRLMRAIAAGERRSAPAQGTAGAESTENVNLAALLAQRETEMKQLRAELKKYQDAARQGNSRLLLIFAVFALVVGGAIGAHYWSTARDEARLAELQAALADASKATQDLDLARRRQEELLSRVKAARLAEDEARAKGDQSRLKDAEEATRHAEAEAARQAEVVRQRAAAAKKAEDAARIAEAKRRSDTAEAAQRAAQEKAAADRALAEQLAAEKAAAEKQAMEKAAAEKRAAEKAALERAAAEKAAKLAAVAAIPAPKPAPPSAAETPGISSADHDRLLEQFREKHRFSMFETREPPPGAVRSGAIVYVNDGTCPRGEIKELIGGDRSRGLGRSYRCVSMSK